MPVGTVFYSCNPQQNWLPTKLSWLPQLRTSPSVYQLELKNASNLYQDICLDVRGKKIKLQDYQVIPSQVRAKPGETIRLKLQITKPRHWLGLTKKLLLETTPILSDLRLGKTDPSSQSLELLVCPLLPVWLQFLLSFLIITLLLWLFSLLQVQQHTDFVNSVSFGSEANIVLSGSEDNTVRRWRVDLNHPLCRWLGWQQYCLRSQGILIDAQTTNGRAVNAVRFRSASDRTSNGEAVIGLEDGTVIRWDVNQEKQLDIIDSEESNRVLTLGFTNNLQDIFIGRGTGIERWNPRTNSLDSILQQAYSIHALTLTKDETTLIAGGLYNKIVAIDLNNTDDWKPLNLYPPSSQISDQISGLAIANNLLVTADNQGSIQTWDLAQCLEQTDCSPITSESKPTGIKALSISQDGQYLVSADDNGKIELLSLPTKQRETIAEYDRPINTIDLITQGTNLLIVSGGQDNRVRLNIYSLLNS